MKAKLIANPSAGKDRAPDVLVALNERLRPATGGELDLVLSTGPGDACLAAEHAVRDACDVVFVAGGDGTLNEVVNGVALAGGLEQVTFGLLPLGTGNDFARALGVPEGVDAALDVIAAARVTQVDLGVMGDRVFVNASAGAFFAEVSAAASVRLKSFAGKLAYVLGGANALLDHEPVPMRVTIDERAPFDLDVSFFAVSNGRTIGGGRLVAPAALVDDGLLDVCLVRAGRPLDLLQVLAEVARAEHVDDERVLYTRARRVELVSPRPFKVNTDGEVLERTRASYDVRPRAARFFAGPELPFSRRA